MQNLLNKFKATQEYLLKQSENFVVLDIDLNNLSTSLDFMQDYILEKIKDAYINGSF